MDYVCPTELCALAVLYAKLNVTYSFILADLPEMPCPSSIIWNPFTGAKNQVQYNFSCWVNAYCKLICTSLRASFACIFLLMCKKVIAKPLSDKSIIVKKIQKSKLPVGKPKCKWFFFQINEWIQICIVYFHLEKWFWKQFKILVKNV